MHYSVEKTFLQNFLKNFWKISKTKRRNVSVVLVLVMLGKEQMTTQYIG